MENPAINGSDLLSLGVSMILVVAAILALGWLYSRTRFSQSRSGDVINIVATRALGPKERLMLIEVGGQTLLVGMTPTQMQTLHTFDGFELATVDDEPASGFADRLRAVVNRSVS